MNCGWCPKTPLCIDMGQYHECPICHHFYYKAVKGSGNDIVEIGLLSEDKPIPIKAVISKVKEKRSRRKKEDLPWNKVMDRKKITKKFTAWMTKQQSRKLRCSKCKTPLIVIDPNWMFRGEEWKHNC